MKHESPELSAYLDEELSDLERRRVQARLAEDPEYAQELRVLERTRTMILTTIEQPQFHGTLTRRIEDESERHPWTLKTLIVSALAASLLIALGGLLYLQFSGSLAVTPPSRGAGAPALVTEHRDSPEELAPVTPLEQLAQGDAVVEPAPAPAAVMVPPVEVVGTMTGDQPQAILKVGGDNPRTATFDVGDVVLPGVTLAAIEQGQVTLQMQDTQLVLTAARSGLDDFGKKLDGTWKLTELFPDGREQQVDIAHVTHEGQAIIVSLPESQQVIRGVYEGSGNQVSIAFPENEDIPAVQGTISGDGNTVELTEVLSAERQQQDAVPSRLRMARVPAPDISGMLSLQLAQGQCRKDLQQIYQALESFSGENEGRFPLALKDLAPDYLPNAALVTSTEERKVEYVAGLVMPKSPVDTRPKEPDHEPAETYPDRLMQFEQALELSGYGKFLKSEVIVRLSYPALALEGTLTTKGDVRVLNTGEDDSQQLAALRASDQNNLKQLGLVIKMFENEHNGYSPPGWLTTYPEYLTDPNVLVNPKDPPSAGWYDYLLPATHLEELAKQYVTDEGDPAAMARAMSELPLAMDTTDWPDGGRNLLFCDGHVEYTREWRGVLQRVQ